VSLSSRVLKANPSLQVSSVYSGSLVSPAAKKATIGTFDLISESVITTNTASVTFSFLPADYTHLELWVSGRTSRSSLADSIKVGVNQATGTGTSSTMSMSMYWQTNIGSTGQGASNASLQYGFEASRLGAANGTATTQGAIRMIIFNYSNPYVRKSAISYGGWVGDNTNGLGGTSYSVMNTLNPITSLYCLPVTSTNFVAGTRFSLYGVA
jgi:hypothetical protein